MADILKEADIDEMEFWPETPWYWEGRSDSADDRNAELLRELRGIKINLHGPIMDLNPSSYNDLVFEATIKEVTWSIALARDLGAGMVTIHPGHRTAKRPPRPEERRKFCRFLDCCLDQASRLGVCLALENLPPEPWNLCSSPDGLAYVLSHRQVGFTLDVSHATAAAPRSRALEFVDLLGDRMINAHISATVDGVQHMPPSTGAAEYVLLALRDLEYQGPLNLEMDDKKYSMPLNKQDKADALRTERIYLESIFD
ncbi:MAG TPA: sugar phosphate isomerase/epimerase family protein [Methanotrichaceae archaeon]|nr:sugar phosphate isomerase/epimerase family protein [Methanotrichaceae archaeon]